MEATQLNVVREAIRRLGGVSRAVAALGGEVSESRWFRWQRAGRVDDIDMIPRVAALTGIRVEVLAGWAPFTGEGDAPPPGPRPVRRRDGVGQGAKVTGLVSAGPIAGFANGLQTRRVLRGSVAM
jgi:hypothetical protein